MKTYAVVFYDGYGHHVKKVESGIPESQSKTDWGIDETDELIMVIGPLEESAVAFVDGERVDLDESNAG